MSDGTTARRAGGAPGRPRLSSIGYLAFIVLCWAGNWPLMKLVLGDIGPLSFAALRLAGAAATIGAVLAAKGERILPLESEWGPLAWTGLLQIGCLFSLNMLGLQFVPPGRASVLVYTMPLWAILFGVWLARERPGRLALGGGLLGFAGLALFCDPSLVAWHDPWVLLGNGELLLAAVLWALGAVLYRRRRWLSGFWPQVFWQLLSAAVPVAALAVALEGGRPIRWTAVLLATLAFNWLIGTGLAYWCWAKVLVDMSAATAGQVVMLVPVIAFLISAAFFGESVTPRLLSSIVLILLGVVLALRASARGGR